MNVIRQKTHFLEKLIILLWNACQGWKLLLLAKIRVQVVKNQPQQFAFVSENVILL